MYIGDDSLYCPPLPLLWMGNREAATPAQMLHRAYVREMWRERGFGGRAVLLARFLTWPFIVCAAVAYMTWRNGRVIAARTGRGIALQLADQLALASGHGILPPWYYMFELYRPGNRARAGDYLHRFETKYNLYFLIKTYLEKGDGHLLADKEAFGALCAEKGVPAPPLIAVAENGMLRAPRLPGQSADAPVRLEGDDFFIKPRQGKGGRDTLRARRLDDGRYRLSDGQVLSRDDLEKHIAALSFTKPLMVQQRLTNHPDMIDLCADALCCVRVLSCLDETGRPEVTNAAFRMALRDDTTVDGLHRGGLAANVDLTSGKLGLATNLGLVPEIGWCSHNPVTGTRIEGRVLPLWSEARALAVEAHSMLPNKVLVGWDVAITGDGPVIVEGNGAPCVDIIQRVTCEPLGSARFGALLAHHLARALSARDRKAAT